MNDPVILIYLFLIVFAIGAYLAVLPSLKKKKNRWKLIH
jgi:hypothetical protein